MGLRQLAAYRAKLTAGVATPYQLAGAPTSGAGGTYADRAAIGSLLVDTTTGIVYVVTAIGGGSITWTKVGTQV